MDTYGTPETAQTAPMSKTAVPSHVQLMKDSECVKSVQITNRDHFLNALNSVRPICAGGNCFLYVHRDNPKSDSDGEFVKGSIKVLLSNKSSTFSSKIVVDVLCWFNPEVENEEVAEYSIELSSFITALKMCEQTSGIILAWPIEDSAVIRVKGTALNGVTFNNTVSTMDDDIPEVEWADPNKFKWKMRNKHNNLNSLFATFVNEGDTFRLSVLKKAERRFIKFGSVSGKDVSATLPLDVDSSEGKKYDLVDNEKFTRDAVEVYYGNFSTKLTSRFIATGTQRELPFTMYIDNPGAKCLVFRKELGNTSSYMLVQIEQKLDTTF